MKNVVAFIPARAGSKRITGKNIRILNGHPVIAYSIRSAIESNLFERCIVSTDSEEIADIALKYGAEVPFLRPIEMATSISPDIEWVRFMINKLEEMGSRYDAFSILRPTSPLRTSEMIFRAWNIFCNTRDADSLRAIELCTQHPAKEWFIEDGFLKPVLENPDKTATPWHSTPYQDLPKVYVQNASLEMCRWDVPAKYGTITGKKITPFLTENYEGFDINTEDDWILLEALISKKIISLPPITTG